MERSKVDNSGKEICQSSFDCAAIRLLCRPGPLACDLADDFIARRHKTSAVVIDDVPAHLRSILASTYGVILYQEQVMQIAHVLAGYSLSDADLFRRALAQGNGQEIAQHRSRFLSGAKAQGFPEAQATKIFESAKRFAGRALNKSHATAYALLTYQTAWLQAHYSEVFMAVIQWERGEEG